MRKLLSSVSEEALFYAKNKTAAKIPAGWDIRGFDCSQVYIRVVEPDEKRHVWRNVPGSFLDWDKVLYGVFSVQTGIALGVSDSRKALRKQIGATTAVEVYLN